MRASSEAVASRTYRFKLPAQAASMASEFCASLGVAALEEPLADFLDQAAQVEGLAALAVAVRPASDAKTLSVYALTDVARAIDGEPASKVAVRQTSRRHVQLRRALRAGTTGFETDLWFVSTEAKPRDVKDVVHRLVRSLMSEDGSAVQSVRVPFGAEQVGLLAFGLVRP